jgi:integrase
VAVNVTDRWHKSRPKAGEPLCKGHNLVPSSAHMQGDRWQVRWDEWVNGVRHQPRRNFALKVGTDPEIHADAFAKKLTADLTKPRSTRELTLTDVANEWLKSLSGDDASVYTIERRVENHIFKGELSNVPIWDIYEDPNLIQQWIKALQASGQEQNYTRAIALHLSSILTFGMFKKYIPNNPMKNSPLVRIPGRSKRVVMPYTTDQLNAITENHPSKHRIIPKTGAGLGLRIGEIFGLSPDDISGDEIHIQRQIKQLHRSGTFVFALPKGGKTRIVPLPRSVEEFLADLPIYSVTLPWVRTNGDPVTVRLYMNPHARGYGFKAISNSWNAALKKAGIVRVPRVDTFHKLRHTYASRLVKKGVDIRTLAFYLGHDDPGFTLREYCHLMLGTGDDARSAIDD